MKILSKISILFIAFTFSISLSLGAADSGANLTKYRKNLMKTLGAHAGSIGAILKGEVSLKENISVHARIINETAGMLLKAFPEGSTAKNSETLPKVWTNWSKFEKLTNDLQLASARLEIAAKKGDMAGIGAAMKDAGKSCKGCHTTFRKKKKK